MILGICGKISSGKSEVMKILAKRGFSLIDADKIVHDLYKKNAVGAKKIAAYFGRAFLRKDGSVNREKLRNIVFNDDDERKMLENLIHPEVYAEIQRLLLKLRGKNVAIESVYFDQGFLADFVDKILWIERPEEEIKKVLIKERGFSEEMAQGLVNLIQKPKKVDFVIENYGSLQDLAKKVVPGQLFGSDLGIDFTPLKLD